MENFKTESPENASVPENHHNHSKHSKLFKFIVAGLLELIIILAVFALGIQVGFHKAGFTYSWINNYPNNFGGSRPPVKLPGSGELLDAHGVVGTVLSTDQNSLIIKDADNNEKTVSVAPDTTLRQNFKDVKFSDLKAGQQIIVIGSPDDQGQIEAKFIRVLN